MTHRIQNLRGMSQCGKFLINGQLAGDRVGDYGVAHFDNTHNTEEVSKT